MHSQLLTLNDVLDYVVAARDAGKLAPCWSRETLARELIERAKRGTLAVSLCRVSGKINGIMAWDKPDPVKQEIFVDNFVADNAEARHALYEKIIKLCNVSLNSGWKFVGKSRKTGRPRLIPITTSTFKKI